MSGTLTFEGVGSVHAALGSLRERMLACEARHPDLLDRTPDAATRASALNLLHYIALREGDLRPLQRELISCGLSSLGRCEAWVLGSVEATLTAAGRLLDPPLADPVRTPGTPSLAVGRALLDDRTNALFGPRPEARAVRIMVTMPEEAATDPRFVAGCLESGMDAMRINTAAGDPEQWLRMIGHLRAAQAGRSRRCRVFADLAGPKIRVSRIVRREEAVERVRLNEGDRVRVSFGGPGRTGTRATIWVSPAELLVGVKAGHAVWFDDGKVGAEVESADGEGLDLRVTFTKPGGQRLRVGKGLNLPDTHVNTPALTDDDRAALEALWGQVDAVSLSFVRGPEDVADLREAFETLRASRGGEAPATVVKIETREGFERLPAILLELLRVPVGGVMIARGDLAVECGFERLAEIQEEMLCFCEAAHTPVIWATEVLSTLAKQGRPTRAEVTDAAAAQRAECVMLNKGPEILAALASLSDILRRMQAHQRKKTPIFRPLSIATVPERG